MTDLYKITVTTDTYGYVFESHMTKNNIKSTQIKVIQKLPDLVVKGMNFHVIRNETLGRFIINITDLTVENNGVRRIDGSVWTDSIYIEYENGNRLNLANMRISETLNIGGRYVHSLYTQISRQKFDSAHIVALVDSSNVIVEKDRDNNKYTTNTISLPLMFDNIEISDFNLLHPLSKTPLKSFFSGTEVAVSIFYRNKQTFPTITGWFDELWLDIGEKQYNLNQFFVQPISGKKVLNKEISISLPENTFGGAVLILRHDIKGYLITSSESLFIVRKEFYLQQSPSPDLLPKHINYVKTLTDVSKTLQINWKVANMANQMSETLTWKDSLVLSRSKSNPYAFGQIILGAYFITARLQPEQSYTHTVDVIIPDAATGNYYLHVIVDAANSVLELNGENNNVLANENLYTVPVFPLPDLTVSLDKVQKTIVNGGDRTVIKYTVYNNGAPTSVSSWTDHLVLQNSDNVDTVQLASLQHIGILERNNSYSKNLFIIYPLYLKSGQYKIKVITDINKKASEASTENNFAVQTIKYIPALQIDFLIATNVTNLTIVTGQPVSISYTVTNLGPGPQTNTFSWPDAIYLSEDVLLDPFDVKLSTLVHSVYLSVNSSYSAIFNFNLPFHMPGKYYYLILKTDNGQTLQDSNVQNNQKTIELKNIATLFSSDLAVVNIQVLRNVEYGKRLSGSWDILNNGTETISGYKCDSFYISLDRKWDVEDSELVTQCGFVSLNGKLSTVNIRSFTMNKLVPLVKQNEYYAVVKTRSNVKDFDLSNNEAVSLKKTLIIHQNLTLEVEKVILANDVNHGVWRVSNVRSGESLLISVKCANRLVSNELFVRFEEPASTETFDVYAGEFISSDQIAVVKNTRRGDYYILLRTLLPSSLKTNDIQIKLLAKLAKFEISNVFPTQATPLPGYTTFKIDGSLFPSDFVVTFVGRSRSDNTAKPGKTYRFSSTEIYATVDLSKFTYGEIVSIEMLDNISGQVAVFKDAITVVVGQVGSIVTQVTSPNGVRVGDEIVLSVDVQNVGKTDVFTPMLYLDVAGDITVNIPVENKTVGSNNFLFMASSSDGPGGIIPPGRSSHIELKISQNVVNVASFPLAINILNQKDEKEHPYVNAADSFRPMMFEDQRWNPVWNLFLKRVGRTIPTFYQRLSEIANHLSVIDDHVISVDELVKFELDLADGFHTGNDIYRVIDLQTNSTDFPYIKMGRYFNPKLSFRNVPGLFDGYGPFGRGWIAPLWWDTFYLLSYYV